MSYEITGNLVMRGQVETKGESFQVREFAIKTNDGSQYDNFVKFQCVQARTSIVDGLSKGDEIKVHFDLRGREYDGKYYTNLNAWRVEKVSEAAPQSTAKPEPTKEPVAVSAGDDDLPF